jgi:adenylate kinase family enzyme
MERIIVIGCCGAGKSTFARRLHDKTGLELIHLDQLHWSPNWVESDKETMKQRVKQTVEKPKWIIDGNYGSTMDIRIEKADTILYLDYPIWKCLWRVTKRIWQYNGKTRPDMTEGCPERWDWEFIHYVATFNLTKRKAILERLEKVKGQKRIEVFKNDRDAEVFLNNFEV